jgi:hypothetical protein
MTVSNYALWRKLQGAWSNSNRKFCFLADCSGILVEGTPFSIHLSADRTSWEVSHRYTRAAPVHVPFPKMVKGRRWRWGKTLAKLSEALSLRHPNWFEVEIRQPPGVWVQTLMKRHGECYREAFARQLPEHELVETTVREGIGFVLVAKGPLDESWNRRDRPALWDRNNKKQQVVAHLPMQGEKDQ